MSSTSAMDLPLSSFRVPTSVRSSGSFSAVNEDAEWTHYQFRSDATLLLAHHYV
jgi:hypothetical protein